MAPTGGPKDEKAPILKKRSVADSALHFKGGKLQFEFDEFLQLKDIANQLVITPLLQTNPKVTIHKKKLTIDLADSLLLPNTTYRISFGNAVQDLHEGNQVRDLFFTFSTGSFFDSLTLDGFIQNAETGKPDTTSWILLYAVSMNDSAFYKQKPMYAQKSNTGYFRFQNLPQREFHIFSIKESNNNLRYDAAGEMISFYPTAVNPADTGIFVTLYSFIENEQIDTATQKIRSRTATIDQKKGTAFSYFVNIDTLQKNKRSFHINDSIVLVFTDSIKKIDIAKIKLFHDEEYDATASIHIDTSGKKIVVKTDWVQDAIYKLILQKGFADNLQGVQAAAASFVFKTKKESDYGYLSVSTMKPNNKIITLYKEDKKIVQKSFSDSVLKFSLLEPGNYQITILEDENRNGSWDPGVLSKKVLPERVTLFTEPITIKANWGNKINIDGALPQKRRNGTR